MSGLEDGCRLEFDRCPAGNLRIGESGQPIWPVQTDGELNQLERVAALFGGELVSTKSELGATTPRNGTVVALGTEVADAAALYAHLTLRTLLIAADLDDLKSLPLPDVVVTLVPHMSAELFEFLYSRNSRRAPGIICAETVEKLHTQVLTKSAAASVRGPIGNAGVVDIDVGETINGKRWSDFSAESLSPSLKQELTKGSAVVSLTTHGDGLHMFLGPRLSLCHVRHPPIDYYSRFAPRCALTGFCHLQAESIDDVEAYGGLLTPEAVRARAIILNTCWGITPADSAIGLAWGVGRGFMEHELAGVVLTTWMISTTIGVHGSEVASALMTGETAGEVLARFNGSSKWQQHGLRMCLFGDPLLRLPAAPVPAPPVATEAPLRSERALRQAAFLRAMLMQSVASSEYMARFFGNWIIETSTRSLQSVFAYEQAVFRGAAVEIPGADLGGHVRRSLMDYILCRGKVEQDWTPLVDQFVTDNDAPPCYICGAAAVSVIQSLRIPDALKRRVTSCPRCGIIEDSPADQRFTFQWRDDCSIEVTGPIPKFRWSIGVRLSAQQFLEHFRAAWHCTGEDEMPTVLKLDQAHLIGPLRLTVVIMWDTDFVTLSQCLPGESKGSEHVASPPSMFA